MTRNEMLADLENNIANAIAADDVKAVKAWRAHRILILDSWKRADARTAKILARKRAMAEAWFDDRRSIH